MTEPVCPIDGTSMRRDVRPLTLTFEGQSETIDVPGWSCKKCAERIFSGKDLKAATPVLNRLKARAWGLLEPAEIKRIRKKLELSQQKAGIMIGGGPRAFQKYESGELLPSKSVSNLLLVLDQHPGDLSILEAQLQKKMDKMYSNRHSMA